MSGAPRSAVGRYKIEGFLARGDRSILYEALDPETGRHVALKLLLPSAARDPDQVDDFLRSAGQLAQLEHANLLPVIDYGREDGVPFITSPVAQGGNLYDKFDAYGQFIQALILVSTLASAVDYLHQNEIVHGRIEPRHILLDAQGQPLLTGVGRPAAGATPAYPAPEQEQGQPPDRRTDIYQLGALLHHLLLGEVPDPGANLTATYQEAGLHQESVDILVTALAADPEQRFDSAAELAGRLNRRLLGDGRALVGDAELVEPLVPEPEELPVAGSEEVPFAEPEEPADVEFEEPVPFELEAWDEDQLEEAQDFGLLEEPDSQPDRQPEAAAPEGATQALFASLTDTNPPWLLAALAGLAVILLLCCALAAFGVYTVSGRLRQPEAVAQIDTNVRAGPTIAYPIVGILRAGERAKIHGISPDGRWWQIAFSDGPGGLGWVPAAFVKVDQLGRVDIVEPPPLTREAALPLEPLIPST